jgi:hypothetical protein
LEDSWQIIKWTWIDQGGVLQNNILQSYMWYDDQSKGLDEHIPKGHTPWWWPLSHVYKQVFHAIKDTSLSLCFSLLVYHWVQFNGFVYDRIYCTRDFVYPARVGKKRRNFIRLELIWELYFSIRFLFF